MRKETMLPEAFLTRMKNMLGEEYAAFLESYEHPRYFSLRINHLKDPFEESLCLLSQKEPVPWAEGGYYYKEEQRPGRHPFHEAGAYYIQEASAMAPAALLSVKPGEKVLDLCAAPGGKSTQLGDAMKGEGLLVCNEIHPQRARILSENIERMGIRNALVLNHDPAVLSEHFPLYFDKVLVDAPCSGEGMFRKNEEAVEEWSEENVKLCAQRQQDILESAAGMVCPGGLLLYSTCTFAPQEDEGAIAAFLIKHPEFHLKEVPLIGGMECGNPAFLRETEAFRGGWEMEKELLKTVRLWPHKLKGEGHFAALLQKDGSSKADRGSSFGFEKTDPEKKYPEWTEFRKSYLKTELSGEYLTFGDQLYLVPAELPSLKGLRVLRAGLHLGTLKKNRFEPSHALALSLKAEEALYSLRLTPKEAAGYMAGETFAAQGEKGWYLILSEDYSAGWGKLAGGIMKNHYPKGLRKQIFLEN